MKERPIEISHIQSLIRREDHVEVPKESLVELAREAAGIEFGASGSSALRQARRIEDHGKFLEVFHNGGWDLDMMEVQLVCYILPDVEEIRRHMARAFFASAWADYQDESPDGMNLSGTEITEVMPQEIPKEAWYAAIRLEKDLVESNGASLDRLYIRSLLGLEEGDRPDRDHDEEMFGHYLAMQAMGSGVGIESITSRNCLKVDGYHEFSYLHLDPEDYPDLPDD